MVSFAVKLLAGKGRQLLCLVDIVRGVSVIPDLESVRKPSAELGKMLFRHIVKPERALSFPAVLHQRLQRLLYCLIFPCRVGKRKSVPLIPKYKSILDHSKFHFIMPGPEVDIHESSLTASARRFGKIGTDQFFVFQLRALKFILHINPPSLPAWQSDLLRSGCR